MYDTLDELTFIYQNVMNGLSKNITVQALTPGRLIARDYSQWSRVSDTQPYRAQQFPICFDITPYETCTRIVDWFSNR